ncbi:hypothetical protein MKX03_032163 [Papaver bracteatum]|nr:hypothetical protein MKX03_032163 [Papaver bracteatum]
MVHVYGSVVQTFDYLTQNGLQGLADIWPRPTTMAWKIIACYAAFEALHQLALPGKRVEGPISHAGNANRMLAYAVTLVTYIGFWWFGIFNHAIVYDHLGEIYSALIFGSLFFCVLLYKRSCCSIFYRFWIIWELFQDNISVIEIYPRIGKYFDIKVFTNCRFGMMSSGFLAVTYFIKQYEMNRKVADSMLVNTVLMLVYVTKFFWWEAGYWSKMDIAHDRAGFYICWGCLVWVPSNYTSPGAYLVNHPVNLGTRVTILECFQRWIKQKCSI